MKEKNIFFGRGPWAPACVPRGLQHFHENSRVFGVNEKPLIFGHFPKGYISKNGGSIFGKNQCFFVNTKDTWILRHFHEKSRVFGVNEKTWILDHFPKGYISKNGLLGFGMPF